MLMIFPEGTRFTEEKRAAQIAQLRERGHWQALALAESLHHTLSPLRRTELDKFGAACRAKPELRGMVQTLFDAMFPRGKSESAGDESLAALLAENGFDARLHEQIRGQLREGVR